MFLCFTIDFGFDLGLDFDWAFLAHEYALILVILLTL